MGLTADTLQSHHLWATSTRVSICRQNSFMRWRNCSFCTWEITLFCKLTCDTGIWNVPCRAFLMLFQLFMGHLRGFFPLASVARHSTDSSGLAVQSWAEKSAEVSLWPLFWSQESRSFLDCQTSYFSRYADWANLTVRRSQPHLLHRPFCARVSPSSRAPSLRSRSRWANAGRWPGPWILLWTFSAHRWWTPWWARTLWPVSHTQTNVDPFIRFHLPLESVLVRPRLVPDLLHPQHHLVHQTSQILPENEVFRFLRVSSGMAPPVHVTAAAFNRRHLLYLQWRTVYAANPSGSGSPLIRRQRETKATTHSILRTVDSFQGEKSGRNLRGSFISCCACSRS